MEAALSPPPAEPVSEEARAGCNTAALIVLLVPILLIILLAALAALFTEGE